MTADRRSSVALLSGGDPEQAARLIRTALRLDDQIGLVRLKAAVAWFGVNLDYGRWAASIERGGRLVSAVADVERSSIAVNLRRDPITRTWDVAHELGHFFEPARPRGGSERWCDRFAAELLMPRQLIERLWQGMDGLALEERVTRLAVSIPTSIESQKIRLDELGIVPRERFDQARRERDQRLVVAELKQRQAVRAKTRREDQLEQLRSLAEETDSTVINPRGELPP